jgi:CRP/FNR family transcriptional regulator
MQDRLLYYIPLFQGLPEDQMQRLALRGRYKDYKAGAIIAGEDEPVKGLYLVVWGRVKVFKSSGDGHEQTLYLLGPSELFCMTSMTEQTLPANLMALEDTRLFILPRDVMEDLAKHEPSLVFNMLSLLIRRLKESMYLIELLSLKEIPQRLASYLLHALALGEGGDIVTLATSQREVAKVLGTTPETLSRVLKKMSGDKIIKAQGRTIRILDHKALEALSGRGSL